MKTIQLELSERIVDLVNSFLKLLPENECRILENGVTSDVLDMPPELDDETAKVLNHLASQQGKALNEWIKGACRTICADKNQCR